MTNKECFEQYQGCIIEWQNVRGKVIGYYPGNQSAVLVEITYGPGSLGSSFREQYQHTTTRISDFDYAKRYAFYHLGDSAIGISSSEKFIVIQAAVSKEELQHIKQELDI